VRPDPSAGDLPEPFPQVPDDARALERDVEALRRERRAQARGARLRRMVAGRTGAGVGTPVVAAVLLVVGLFAALPVVLRPGLDEDPDPRPLAAPTVAVGQVGGLLPGTVLRTPAGELRVRDVARPGVLVLVPTACGCDPAVLEALLQSREFTHNVRVVTDGREPGAAAESVRLQHDVGRGLVASAVDPRGTLATAYPARGVTVLPVAADGVVLDVVADVRQGQRLEARLSVLRRRG
jgi:hypothetical protein